MAIPIPGVWGIDLGQCALKAVRLQMVEGEVTATAFDYIEHPKILNQPDADPDELTREALQQFLARNQLKGDMVVISVPGQTGLARFVKLPPVEEKKIADIVRFEAKQQIPFPLEEVVWDFQKIGAGLVTDGFAMETEIGLFAMKKDMVYRAIQQFKDVSVEVHVIQMAPLALCNYVAYDLLDKTGATAGEGGEESADKKECVVALDIGTDNTNLVITDGEKIIWQRPIPLGGNHFTRALTKDMKLTFAKAEHLKRNAVKSPDLKKILSSLKQVLNDFVGEVQRSLGYFTNTHRDAQIQYMVGLGNAFRLPGLQKYLQEKLQLEVRKLTGLERLSGEEVTAAPTFSENLMSFAVAYGLALQGLKLTRLQTNLLPYEIRVERIVRAKKPWAVAAAAALLLAVAGLAFGYSIERGTVFDPDIKKAQDQAESAKKRAEAMRAEYDGEIRKIKESEEAIEQIGAGTKERFNWVLLEQYINMSLPRPNGDKVVKVTRGQYPAQEQFVNKKSAAAFTMHEARRFQTAGASVEPAQWAKDDEFIKKNLIQINIEGISALYSDDLPSFFKNVYKHSQRLEAMSPAESKLVKDYAATKEESPDAKGKLPAKGWVVEIRGYTYHGGENEFVVNTIIENLANPGGVGNVLSKEMKERILDRMGFLMLFDRATVVNPDPTTFKHIQKSTLKTLIKGGGGGDKDKKDVGGEIKMDKGGGGGGGGEPGAAAKVNRDGWKPFAEIASATYGDVDFKGGAGGNVGAAKDAGFQKKEAAATSGLNLPPRTEFVILFVWREPLPGDPAGAPSEQAKKE